MAGRQRGRAELLKWRDELGGNPNTVDDQLWHRNAGWLGLPTRKAERRDELASWSEDTRLCRGLEIRSHLERMARPQGS